MGARKFSAVSFTFSCFIQVSVVHFRMAGKTSQTMNGSSGRLLVRTCNGLELRPTLSLHDPLPYRGFDTFGDFLGSSHEYSPT